MTTTRQALTRFWPQYGLELLTPRLQLRVLADDDLAELIELVLGGVHEPDRMPFGVPWTAVPRAELIPNTLRYHWAARGGQSPQRWTLAFGVRVDGVLAGVQDLGATDFAALRVVRTGSYLGLGFHGRGIGTEMRSAVLQFAFDHLHASEAQTGAFADNPASQGVTRHQGYRENGRGMRLRQGVPVEHIYYRLPAAEFRRPDWRVQVSGLAAALPALGLDPGEASDATPGQPPS